MRAAVVGDNCIDVYADLDLAYPTGNAFDVGVHLRQQGVATSFIGYTGDDHYGDWVTETLTELGFDLSRLGRLPGPTAIAELGMDGSECLHQRYHEGVQANLPYTGDQVEFAAGHDLVHSTPWASFNDHLPAVAAGGAMISFDYSDRQDAPDSQASMPYVDYGFFSLRERDQAARDVLRMAVDRGVGTAVATLGPQGSIAFDGVSFVNCPARRAARVVNTVGAGDSFIAAFLFQVMQGRPLAECLAAGARLSADVVGWFGPWRATPLRDAAGRVARTA